MLPLFFVDGLHRSDWYQFVPLGVSILFFTFVAHLLARGVMSGETPTIQVWFLELGRCPSCAQPIAGNPPEADGCVVCGECGAAWEAFA